MADHKVTVSIQSGTKKKKKPSDAGKKPAANPGGEARPQLAPTAAAGTNPMTHPGAPGMQPPTVSATAPIAGANPGGDPSGKITPTPTADVRQVRQNINFRDLPQPAQAQVMGQQGINMDQPRAQLEQSANQAIAGGPSQGPVPNVLAGPMTPPGVESLPSDIAHLSQLMQQGFSPGSNPQEHALGQNAESLMRAHQAMQQSQEMETAPMEQAEPMQEPMAQEQAEPPMAPDQLAPSPQMGGAPPQDPGAPGGIPPALIAQLMAEAQRKKRPPVLR